MNLFFRFFLNLILARCSKLKNVNDSDIVSMRVLPNDLDLNIHMNNSRFLGIMDIGRMRLSVRTGLHHKAIEKKWGFGVVGGLNITFLKSLMPFQKYQLKTRLAGHYDGWFFIEQRFESKGKLIAAALVKVIFLSKGKRVPIEDIIKEMGVEEIGENKEYLEHLFKSEKEFLNYLKNDY